MQIYPVDEAMLSNPSIEDGPGALDYYLNACGYLFNVLHGDLKLRQSPFTVLLEQVFEFLLLDPKQRKRDEAEEAAKWVVVCGVVGKALWFLRDKDSPQMRRELARLANDPRRMVVANQFLFYIAGSLAADGYDIEFVREEGNAGVKTPDLRATKDGNSTWIEANAKDPVRAVDTALKISQMMRDVFEEKKLKFSDARFSPGMIVADISPADHLVNETGTPPRISLLPNLVRPLPGGGFLYRLYEEPEWKTRPENIGNVVSYVTDEFSQIDRTRYHVYQCLIAMTRRVFKSHEGLLAFPKYHLLVVDRSAEKDALMQLARIVYVV